MNPRLRTLADEVLRASWRDNPTLATGVGIHEHDHRLVDWSPEALEERRRSLAGHRLELARLLGEPPALGADEALDAQVLAAALECDERQLLDLRLPHRDPAAYLEEIQYGVYYLMEREFAPLAERAHAAARRLGEAPRLLDQARRNLGDPGEIPREWAGAALGQSRGGLQFLASLETEIVPRCGTAAPELKRACDAALRALQAFETHLRERVLPEARGAFEAGRDLFETLLRTQHGIGFGADELEEIGRALVTEARASLKEAARELDPDRSWQDQIEDWKGDHPDERALVHEYRREAERAREHVRLRELLTLPEGERLRVVETPPFQRMMTPFAAYLAPAAFEDDREGMLWVTPPDTTAPAEVRTGILADHMRAAIPATVVHEAYPGHHVQISIANRITSRVRRYFVTPILIEGWAFYCEQMMAEQGFYTDARSRILQLKDQLWRACRVVIDVGLHTRGLGVDEAAGLLTEVARLEPSNARAEVLRYTRTPTQPMSYAIGKRAILGLREETRLGLGREFDLQKFHDTLLSFGSIPVSMIRERMVPAAPGAPGGLPAVRS